MNEASYHHVKDLFKESLDVEEAVCIKVLNFLKHDGVYTANEVSFNDCEALKMYKSDNKGFLVLKNGNKNNETLDVGSMKKD